MYISFFLRKSLFSILGKKSWRLWIAGWRHLKKIRDFSERITSHNFTSINVSRFLGIERPVSYELLQNRTLKIDQFYGRDIGPAVSKVFQFYGMKVLNQGKIVLRNGSYWLKSSLLWKATNVILVEYFTIYLYHLIISQRF